MKENYRKYSDAISIDSTYNTNKYLPPLVTFIGISNYGKILPFGQQYLLSLTRRFIISTPWIGLGLIMPESLVNYERLFKDFWSFIKLPNSSKARTLKNFIWAGCQCMSFICDDEDSYSDIFHRLPPRWAYLYLHSEIFLPHYDFLISSIRLFFTLNRRKFIFIRVIVILNKSSSIT